MLFSSILLPIGKKKKAHWGDPKTSSWSSSSIWPSAGSEQLQCSSQSPQGFLWSLTGRRLSTDSIPAFLMKLSGGRKCECAVIEDEAKQLLAAEKPVTTGFLVLFLFLWPVQALTDTWLWHQSYRQCSHSWNIPANPPQALAQLLLLGNDVYGHLLDG